MPQVTLNLSEKERPITKEYLTHFEHIECSDRYVSLRVKHAGHVITLYTTGKLLIQGNEPEAVRKEIEKLFRAQEPEVGIDEVGRGEAHGPFVIAGVLGINHELRELRDSKKTNNIEQAYRTAMQKIHLGIAISFSPSLIDSLRTRGLTMNEIEARAINTIIPALGNKKVTVDGSPLEGVKADFLVKGDDLVPVISAASVIAKHIRNQSKKTGIRTSWKH